MRGFEAVSCQAEGWYYLMAKQGQVFNEPLLGIRPTAQYRDGHTRVPSLRTDMGQRL